MPSVSKTRRPGDRPALETEEPAIGPATGYRTQHSDQTRNTTIIHIDSDSEDSPARVDQVSSSAPPVPGPSHHRSSNSTGPSFNLNNTIVASSNPRGGRKRPRPIDLTHDDPNDSVDILRAHISRWGGPGKAKARSESSQSPILPLTIKTPPDPTPPASSFLSELEEDFTCPICYDIFLVPMNLHCGHVFCESCLQEWFERARECPTCRDVVKGKPSRVLLLESVAEKFIKNQVDQLRSKGDVVGSDALVVARAKRRGSVSSSSRHLSSLTSCSMQRVTVLRSLPEKRNSEHNKLTAKLLFVPSLKRSSHCDNNFMCAGNGTSAPRDSCNRGPASSDSTSSRLRLAPRTLSQHQPCGPIRHSSSPTGSTSCSNTSTGSVHSTFAQTAPQLQPSFCIITLNE